MYYSSQKIKTYNRLYNLIVGLRGVGKTYHFTKQIIDMSLREKKCCGVWLTRLIKHADKIKKEWWSDLQDSYPQYQFFNLGYKIYAKHLESKELICVCEIGAISDYLNFKGVPRPSVKIIVFDEFMVEGEGEYLTNELPHFLNICDSIIRTRNNVRVFLLGNACSMINPYFEYFGIKGDTLTNNFIKGQHDSVLENCDYEEFKKYRENSKFGKSIENTKYGSYAIDNKFYLDNLDDIKELKGVGRVCLQLILHNNLISVKEYNGLLYFDSSKDLSYKTYTIYPNDCKLNGAYLLSKNNPIVCNISDYFLRGACLFKNLKIKNEIQYLVMYKYHNYLKE